MRPSRRRSGSVRQARRVSGKSSSIRPGVPAATTIRRFRTASSAERRCNSTTSLPRSVRAASGRWTSFRPSLRCLPQRASRRSRRAFSMKGPAEPTARSKHPCCRRTPTSRSTGTSSFRPHASASTSASARSRRRTLRSFSSRPTANVTEKIVDYAPDYIFLDAADHFFGKPVNPGDSILINITGDNVIAIPFHTLHRQLDERSGDLQSAIAGARDLPCSRGCDRHSVTRPQRRRRRAGASIAHSRNQTCTPPVTLPDAPRHAYE